MTLIELILSVALLSLIIASTAAFYFYGANTFTHGEKQVNIQRNIRLAADYIADEVRNSTVIELSQSNAMPIDCNRGLLLEGVAIKCFTAGYSMEEASFSPVSDVLISVEDVSGKAVLKLTIKGTEGMQSFEIIKEVLLNNTSVGSFQGKVDMGRSYSLKDYILYYAKN